MGGTGRRQLALAESFGGTGRGDVWLGDVRQVLSALPQGLQGRCAMVLTSPPYGTSVHGQVRVEQGVLIESNLSYSDDAPNLAHVGIAELQTVLQEVFAACVTFLRPGGIAVVTRQGPPYNRTPMRFATAIQGIRDSLGSTFVAQARPLETASRAYEAQRFEALAVSGGQTAVTLEMHRRMELRLVVVEWDHADVEVQSAEAYTPDGRTVTATLMQAVRAGNRLSAQAMWRQ